VKQMSFKSGVKGRGSNRAYRGVHIWIEAGKFVSIYSATVLLVGVLRIALVVCPSSVNTLKYFVPVANCNRKRLRGPRVEINLAVNTI